MSKRDEIQYIIDRQYYILVMAEEMDIDRDSEDFKEFKRRIFKNVEYLKNIQEKNKFSNMYTDWLSKHN